MIKTIWKYTVSKDDFKRRMKSGDLINDISNAREMIANLFSGNKDYESTRYKDVSKQEKIDWLSNHIRELTDGMETVAREDIESKKDRFINDYFEVKYKEEDAGIYAEPVKEL